MLAAIALALAPIVVSAAPQETAITFYRDPERAAGAVMDMDPNSEEPLNGFALLEEVREVTVPAGRVTLRLEGVAGSIVPQSALLYDITAGEKNFDARLLSQRGLIDGFAGQRVTVRRADPVTGKPVEDAGTILSGADALVLKTARGVEAVQCEGSLNTLLFPGRPVDLTAKPTLSVELPASNTGGALRLRLVYLAGNFDWQADYVGTFSADGRRLALSSWLTLGSRDRTRFERAQVSAIAGMIKRAAPTDAEEEAAEREREADPYAPDNIAVSAGCWPLGRTAAARGHAPLFTPRPYGTVEAPIAVRMGGGWGGWGAASECGEDEDGESSCDDIVVTGMRRADQSDVGDAKLYTLQHRSDIGARSIKQVRFLDDRVLKGEFLHHAVYRGDYVDDAKYSYRLVNDKASGLGEPLPRGRIALFQDTPLGRHPIGEVPVKEKAVGERLDIDLPDAGGDDVDFDADEDDGPDGSNWSRVTLTVRNDGDRPITAEVEFADTAEHTLGRFSRRLEQRDGRPVWRVVVPPEKERTIRFRRTELPERADY
ncbi:hypothetical protein CHU93_03055 [Sandarakinorhabdus cyanobacteriorum]|uniref:DUF4139 domain-containing protein n=1 Tax=Sandarakinorhabdus cyanobacteriorum TaxID=1981098 RepID=A0A255YVG3_9SPHN|nr:hypothetical protein [Sandarakinorhabdus cyanobacteriorum]OYQ33227.1 hypothetical protein CHU93_03055 [Sandarakinorhabdus cyanobacteriorum]